MTLYDDVRLWVIHRPSGWKVEGYMQHKDGWRTPVDMRGLSDAELAEFCAELGERSMYITVITSADPAYWERATAHRVTP